MVHLLMAGTGRYCAAGRPAASSHPPPRVAGTREGGRASLLGAVRNPGGFEIKDGTTLAEALAAGGGPSPTADLRRVTITRADGSVKTVDMAQTDRTGRIEQNLELQPGDMIV